jgi:opacity protein-like surface antigen
MKKYLLIVLALAVALSFCAPAMAKQGASVGVSFGILPNAAGLGTSIANDGLDKNIDIDGAANTTGYDTLILIPSEKSMLDDETSGLVKDVEVNGPMTAMDFGFVARYDMLGYLFVKTGFNYSMKMSGGESKYTFVAGGAKNEFTWDYQAWAIPLTIGFNLPLNDGKLNLYMGLSGAYMSGYWEVDCKIQQVTSTIGAAGTGVNNAITALDAGTAKDTPKFEASGIGMGYMFGVDAEVAPNISVFVEYEALALVDYAEYKIKDAGFKAAGITHFNYPVQLGGSFIKFGAKYNLGFATL